MTNLIVIGVFIVFIIYVLFTALIGFNVLKTKEIKRIALWGYIALGNIIQIGFLVYIISTLNMK